MPAFSEMELPPDAVAFAEVFHPSLSGSSYSLGRVSQHAEGLYRDVLMPDFPSPSTAGVRIVVRHPTQPYFVARPQRLPPPPRHPGTLDGPAPPRPHLPHAPPAPPRPPPGGP